MVKKAFLVTGLSNALGGHEDDLIQNNTARKEVEELVTEVFGEHLGFDDCSMMTTDQVEVNDSLEDPFRSNDQVISMNMVMKAAMKNLSVAWSICQMQVALLHLDLSHSQKLKKLINLLL